MSVNRFTRGAPHAFPTSHLARTSPRLCLWGPPEFDEPHSEQNERVELVRIFVLLAVNEASNIARIERTVQLFVRTLALEWVVVTTVRHRVLLDGLDSLFGHPVDDRDVLVATAELNDHVAWNRNVSGTVAVERELAAVDPVRAHAVDVVEAAPALLCV